MTKFWEIENVYSNVEKGLLLHQLYTPTEKPKRVNISPESESLQVAHICLKNNQTFKAHKHIFKDVPPTSIAQESWYVVRGAVKAKLYDEDFTHLTDILLEEGDLSITLYGGHTYEIMQDDTLVLEFKSGPYYGQKLDKEFMNDD